MSGRRADAGYRGRAAGRPAAASKTARAEPAHEKFMADMRTKPDVNPMPFDGKRLIYGGFEMTVEA